ncbi:acyl-CoA thioesterase [Roseateles albus]|uniref:Acyl-CoA thioesterase n=1 Tax=Roseateles albus TaxID=2987525 RepID=A0ABT5KG79_9BURK|nr:acyl-CoA thioesterase [Roseateles albus]MDC8772925.1 acyl-CoA thioesterase [Roseateles albus]
MDTNKSEQRLPAPHAEMDLELKVRDYECDMGQVVNNAVYLNYLEHARHELLQSLGISFAQLAKRSIDLVVTRIEADFKASLTSGDSFVVRTAFERKGRLRLAFNQSIYRLPDNKLMLNAVVIGAALNERGRPTILPELLESFGSLG